MNRIEERLNALKNSGKKAFITYITAGLPSLEDTAKIIKAQAEGGVDVIEIGVPFSDPLADGPVIQKASFEAIQNGCNINGIFQMMTELRKECNVPVILMLYYNTINHYGIERFVKDCIKHGVDGLIVPDLPYEETFEIKAFLNTDDAPYLIPLVSPISGDRVPMIVKDAKGFVYCVSSMGVTGQGVQNFHKNTHKYLEDVKKVSKIPVMMGFGIKTFSDVAPFIDTIDGCIVGSYFIKLMREHNFDPETAKQYVQTFKKEMNKE